MYQASTTIGREKQFNLLCLARRFFSVSLVGLLLFCLSFLVLPYLLVEASAATDISTDASWVATTLTLDPDFGNGNIDDEGHGDVAFGTIIPTSTSGDNIGTMKVLKKTINVTTSGKYYSVYLSMSGTSNALKLDGTDSNLKIDAVSGTWDAPSVFSDAEWGFAVPGTTIPTNSSTWEDSSVPEYPTFSQSTTFYNSSTSSFHDLDADLTATNNSGVYNKDTWASVPVFGSAQQIWKNETTSSNGFSSGDSFDVYYGIMVDEGVVAGNYSNEIVYTALASQNAVDSVSKNLIRDTYFVSSDSTETLNFDLVQSVAGVVKPEDVVVYLVPHSDIISDLDSYNAENPTATTSDYVIGNTLTANKSSYSKCSGSGTGGVLTSSDVSFEDLRTTITCSMPDSSVEGHGDGVGSYDFWVEIMGYGFNYLSEYKENNVKVASVVYAGLQSTKDSAGNTPYVSKMQDMTGNVCKNTNMWNNQTGDSARIYDYRGYESGTALLPAGVDTVGISSFTLTDARDSKPYLVRRLADGNCWMVENLDLDLVATANGTINLTSENTDLNSKTSWTPDKETINDVFLGSTSARAYENDFKYITYDSSTGTFAQAADSAYNSSHSTQYIGDYYNWYAATAESIDSETKYTSAPDSICAKAWRLPLHYFDNQYRDDFVDLILEKYGVNTSNSEKIFEIPLSFVNGGTMHRTALYGVTTWSLYWSGTANGISDSGDSMSNLFSRSSTGTLNPIAQNPIGGMSRGNSGLALRCVARD